MISLCKASSHYFEMPPAFWIANKIKSLNVFLWKKPQNPVCPSAPSLGFPSAFQGYSFVAPSILFKRNAALVDPLQLHLGVERPGATGVARSAMMKVDASGYFSAESVIFHEC